MMIDAPGIDFDSDEDGKHNEAGFKIGDKEIKKVTKENADDIINYMNSLNK